MSKFLFYHHGGSYNHGCEAIVKGTKNILSKYGQVYVYVSSENSFEDREYFNEENIGEHYDRCCFGNKCGQRFCS